MFSFGNETASLNAAVTANIPTNLRSKEVLFATFAELLKFPDYFGNNWDAFDECIQDLSWLPNGPVVVKHDDIPLANDIRQAKIYILLLSDAARRMPTSGNHPLSIVFPERYRDQVMWLLRLSQRINGER